LQQDKPGSATEQLNYSWGVPADHNEKVKLLIDSLDLEIKKNIRVVSLVDPQLFQEGTGKETNKPLFV
jgi:hypothetical protein